MLSPPSLPQHIRDRAFRASNGELGVLPADTDAFLEACRADDLEVMGWELWLIDHTAEPGGGGLRSSPGQWCGLIPPRDGVVPAVVGGHGDLRETRREIAELQLEELVEPRWLTYLRFNFTLDEAS